VSSILSGVLVFLLTLPVTAGSFNDRSPGASQSSLGTTTSTRTGGPVFPPPSTSPVLPPAPDASGSPCSGFSCPSR
jgi:hypothetical protein